MTTLFIVMFRVVQFFRPRFEGDCEARSKLTRQNACNSCLSVASCIACDCRSLSMNANFVGFRFEASDEMMYGIDKLKANRQFCCWHVWSRTPQKCFSGLKNVKLFISLTCDRGAGSAFCARGVTKRSFLWIIYPAIHHAMENWNSPGFVLTAWLTIKLHKFT